MADIEIRSMQQLLDALRENAADYEKPVWFRGQSVADWPLLPGYLRNPPRVSETSMLIRFRQSAAMLLSNTPTTSFDWLFLMQHYGVPTRLLDWSESPLVALYFSTCESGDNDNTDAALWALKPCELNQTANIRATDEETYIPSFDDQELDGWSIESIRNTRFALTPIATIATRNNPRIQAQLGVFTIHHNDRTPIEDIGDGTHVTKYIIPSDAKQDIREELRILGINKFQMFPELASVGEIIKDGAL